MKGDPEQMKREIFTSRSFILEAMKTNGETITATIYQNPGSAAVFCLSYNSRKATETVTTASDTQTARRQAERLLYRIA